jgi:hypothetical protein
LRDNYDGAWARVSTPDKVPVPTSVYTVYMSVPLATADLTSYSQSIPAFLKAVNTALQIYNAQKNLPPTVKFLPPFGLAMQKTTSIQLLHYPPLTTLDYMDYLYSATNRRWENLLANNNYPGNLNTLNETIVDLVPIAADGGPAGNKAISSAQTAFTQTYVPQMLNVFLQSNTNNTATTPVVAYGGEVLKYLKTLNLKDLNPNNKTPGPLSLFMVPWMNGGPPTPVLYANHPAQFMYYPDTSLMKPPPSSADAAYKAILVQDLTAAGWQSMMSHVPNLDPLQTLQGMISSWAAQPALVDAIFAEQIAEFTNQPPPSNKTKASANAKFKTPSKAKPKATRAVSVNRES